MSTTTAPAMPAAAGEDHVHTWSCWEHTGGCEHRWCSSCGCLDIHPDPMGGEHW